MTTPSIGRLDGLHFDVAIVGAGINGASAAQHLGAAGYRVLVVDQGDFANGATSRSSRLLHCGLRHLASGADLWTSLSRPGQLLRSMGTARDDMLARDEIVGSIPNRLKPINFCLPIYRDDPYAPWHMDVAFKLLRMMSPRGVALDYRRFQPGKLEQVPIGPWLRDPGRLKSVAVFREYLFDWPERIALDALFDARRLGAEVRNYTQVEELERLEADGRWRLSLRSSSPNQPEIESNTDQTAGVTADMVLNLAGAWVDKIIARTGKRVAPKCAGIKGIHIALRLPQAFADWGLFTYNSIGEPLYCLPANGFHYIGLTRRTLDGDITGVAASDDEIDCMIAETNRCMPQLAVTRADILFTWAGVNPLTFDPKIPLGSREIALHDLAADGLPGMLALTGGPIMTHRRVANRLLRAVSQRLPPSGSRQEMSFQSTRPEIEQNPAQITSEAFSVSTAEVKHCARHEQPGTLADLLMRRLGAGWASDQGLALARPVAETAATELGWPKARIEDEVLAYRQHLSTARRRPGT
jgi:glycerol-3-phosphate dehydrogenase